MSEIRDVLFNTPNDEEFKAFLSENITENLNHARHVETEIHTFTGIYMAVVAGVLAFDFSGRQGVAFGVVVHLILLLGGMLAILLLNRWYTGFDTFMASAECLSYLKERLIAEKVTPGEAVDIWRAFSKRYREIVKNGERRPDPNKKGKYLKTKQIAIDDVIKPIDDSYNTADRLFAFSVPNSSSISTRDYVYGFHIVILISVAIIIIKDLYGIVILT